MFGQLAEATPEPDTAEWLFEKGTLPGGKTVAEAPTREIQSVVRDVAKKTKKRAIPLVEKEAERAAREVQKVLRSGGAKGASATTFRRKGEIWVRVEMPGAQAGVLLRK